MVWAELGNVAVVRPRDGNRQLPKKEVVRESTRQVVVKHRISGIWYVGKCARGSGTGSLEGRMMPRSATFTPLRVPFCPSYVTVYYFPRS